MAVFRIDRIGAKEGKESIFRIEARESQSYMIRTVAEKAGREKSESEPLQDGLTEVTVLELSLKRTLFCNNTVKKKGI